MSESTQPITDDENEETYLYRHFDADGTLLYVGISLHAVARLARHREESHWFRQIRRVDIEPFAARGLAAEAERKAIIAENPRYNVQSRKATTANLFPTLRVMRRPGDTRLIQITVYLSADIKDAIEKERIPLGQTQSSWIEQACLQALGEEP